MTLPDFWVSEGYCIQLRAIVENFCFLANIVIQVHAIYVSGTSLCYIWDQNPRVVSVDGLNSLVIILDVDQSIIGHDPEFFEDTMYDARNVIPVYMQRVFVQIPWIHLCEALVGYFVAFLVSGVEGGQWGFRVQALGEELVFVSVHCHCQRQNCEDE